MMEEWKEYRLDEVCKSIADGDHMPPPKVKRGIPFVTISNIKDNRLDLSDTYFVPQEYYDALDSKRKPKMGDTIYSVVGTFGKPVYIKDNNPFVFQRHIAILRPDASFLNPLFLYYTLLSPQFYTKADIMAIGAVQRTISLTSLRNATIQIPSLTVQEEIVSILKTLDDKIEVNRRINENLEQQAQALFKSWFVDFEPFKDGEFVESELGMIPKGWKVGTVNDVCCFESGFAFKSTTYKQEGEYRLITIKNVQDGYLDVNGSVCLDELPAKMPQYCLLRIGDILLSLTGNVGRCCFVDEERLLLNQRVAKLKPRIKNNWGYIYTLFRNPSFKDRVVSIARGTAQANLSPIETSNMKIIIPIDKVLEDFSAIVDESYRIMINNKIESRRLAELRDTLLPKLMSGELKVNEIEI